MGIATKYYLKRYDQWFKAKGFLQHKVLAEFGTVYDHMYLYFTKVIGLEKDVAISLIDEFRVDEVLEAISKKFHR